MVDGLHQRCLRSRRYCCIKDMEVSDYMDKATLLAEINDKHADMGALLASLDERQMTQQGVYGELSVKDVLAHIVAWERMMLGWLASSQQGVKPIRFAPRYTFEESDSEEAVIEVMDKLN